MSLEKKVKRFGNRFFFNDEITSKYRAGSEILLNSSEFQKLQDLVEKYFKQTNKILGQPKETINLKKQSKTPRTYKNKTYATTYYSEQIMYTIFDQNKNYYGLVFINCSETEEISEKTVINYNPEVDYRDAFYNRPLKNSSQNWHRNFSIALQIGLGTDTSRFQKREIEASIFINYLERQGFEIEIIKPKKSNHS